MHIISKDGMGYLHKEWSVVFDSMNDIGHTGFKLLYAVTSYELLENVRIKLQKINKSDGMLEVSKEHFLEMDRRTLTDLFTNTDWVLFGTFKKMRISLSYKSDGKIILGVPLEITEKKEEQLNRMLLDIQFKLNSKKGL